MDAELRFWFDPVCPFAWLTSKWVRRVASQRSYQVEWLPISLRLINKDVDYASRFPPEYEAGHTAGLRLLRVCAAAREASGPEAVGRLYEQMGTLVWEQRHPDGDTAARVPGTAADALSAAGLPAELAGALEDTAWDAGLQASTDEALALTGKDVGTPILHFQPPQGVAFFGPVISRLPADDRAVELWDHVVGLAAFPGFAELKRSLRELPQLPALGVSEDEVGVQEDWHGGSRRQHR